MGSVSVRQVLQGSVHGAETCWYEVARWPEWVDELARVIEVEGDWPRVGGSVTWESGPAGRGRVHEQVIDHEPLGGQTLEVEDDSITGTQQVAFTPAGQDVEVALSLTYRIKRRSLFTPLVDTLFVRRVMAASLARTLTRFAGVLAESRSAPVE
ncbi:MAG: SRPBCC family protein [Solirubrobacteraceae bacterium]